MLPTAYSMTPSIFLLVSFPLREQPVPTAMVDPVLFLDYLVSLLPRDSFLREEGLGRWGCVVCLNLSLSYLAYRGLRYVVVVSNSAVPDVLRKRFLGTQSSCCRTSPQ